MPDNTHAIVQLGVVRKGMMRILGLTAITVVLNVTTTQAQDERTWNVCIRQRVSLDALEACTTMITSQSITTAPQAQASLKRAEALLPESQTASAAGSGVRRLGDALPKSAVRNGLQRAMVVEFLNEISSLLDATMPVGSGDWVKIETNPAGTRIVAASFSIGSFHRTLYRFTTAEGIEGFYSAQGQSIEAKISRKPIANAVFSAGFELRRHPILGYDRLHSGLDWGAAVGEPIYAGAPGVVVRISVDEVSEISVEIAARGSVDHGLRPSLADRAGDRHRIANGSGKADRICRFDRPCNRSAPSL